MKDLGGGKIYPHKFISLKPKNNTPVANDLKKYQIGSHARELVEKLVPEAYVFLNVFDNVFSAVV